MRKWGEGKLSQHQKKTFLFTRSIFWVTMNYGKQECQQVRWSEMQFPALRFQWQPSQNVFVHFCQSSHCPFDRFYEYFFCLNLTVRFLHRELCQCMLKSTLFWKEPGVPTQCDGISRKIGFSWNLPSDRVDLDYSSFQLHSVFFSVFILHHLTQYSLTCQNIIICL